MIYLKCLEWILKERGKISDAVRIFLELFGRADGELKFGGWEWSVGLAARTSDETEGNWSGRRVGFQPMRHLKRHRGIPDRHILAPEDRRGGQGRPAFRDPNNPNGVHSAVTHERAGKRDLVK